jgi:WD40 repeat protein
MVGNAVAFLGARRIVTTSYDRTLKLWDVATGETVLTLRGHAGPVIGVACRPDGTPSADFPDAVGPRTTSNGTVAGET